MTSHKLNRADKKGGLSPRQQGDRPTTEGEIK